MKRALLLACLLVDPAWAAVPAKDLRPEGTLLQDSVPGTMLNLSALEALVAVGHSDLSGVFSFITEKDAAPAFADFLARNKPAMKKYLAKLQKDLKDAGGIPTWDHDVVMKALDFYASPLAETVEKPAESVRKALTALSVAPTMALSDVTAKRKK